MGYRAVDEIENFRYDDCQITGLYLRDEEICIEVESLIVGRNNSQNTNFTESYAGTTKMHFKGGKIEHAIKDGYRYYDANEVLLQEVKDRILEDDEAADLYANCGGSYLYNIEITDRAKEQCCRLYIEFVDDENLPSESYTLEMSYDEAVFVWERYLNRVQQ